MKMAFIQLKNTIFLLYLMEISLLREKTCTKNTFPGPIERLLIKVTTSNIQKACGHIHKRQYSDNISTIIEDGCLIDAHYKCFPFLHNPRDILL